MSASSFYKAELQCLFVSMFFSCVVRDGVVSHIFPPVPGTETRVTHMRDRRPTTELHPKPSSFFPLWDLTLILLYAHFYVKSISFLKELLPRVPFCNFSEHHFELSRSVIKTWWLSPCGFLVLFSSPTFVLLLFLCRPVLNCLFVFTAVPSWWGVQAPSAPPWVPGTYPGVDIPGSICWDFLWSEVSSPPSFPVSFPHGCWLLKALWSRFQPTCTVASAGVACHLWSLILVFRGSAFLLFFKL